MVWQRHERRMSTYTVAVQPFGVVIVAGQPQPRDGRGVPVVHGVRVFRKRVGGQLRNLFGQRHGCDQRGDPARQRGASVAPRFLGRVAGGARKGKLVVRWARCSMESAALCGCRARKEACAYTDPGCQHCGRARSSDHALLFIANRPLRSFSFVPLLHNWRTSGIPDSHFEDSADEHEQWVVVPRIPEAQRFHLSVLRNLKNDIYVVTSMCESESLH